MFRTAQAAHKAYKEVNEGCQNVAKKQVPLVVILVDVLFENWGSDRVNQETKSEGSSNTGEIRVKELELGVINVTLSSFLDYCNRNKNPKRDHTVNCVLKILE